MKSHAMMNAVASYSLQRGFRHACRNARMPSFARYLLDSTPIPHLFFSRSLYGGTLHHVGIVRQYCAR